MEKEKRKTMSSSSPSSTTSVIRTSRRTTKQFSSSSPSSSSSTTITTRPTDAKNAEAVISPSLSSSLNILQVTKSLTRISTHPTLTPFRRRVYRTLLSVPPGRWTTYATLATCVGSGPRAIGNAMKNNPFAPGVPCHRVLATDRTLGGYKGLWGNGGEYSVEKRKLLVEEGVEFDERGRAKGTCFGDFVELEMGLFTGGLGR